MNGSAKSTLSGFTLPLSPSGTAALVDTPPWHFGGELIEIVYRTDPEAFAALLPEPFVAIPEETFVSIVMVDMVSATSAEQAHSHPEKTNYHECIIKMHCSLLGEKVWYAPAAWVSKDFSVMRGFLLGFGKKIGTIEITKLHPLNPVLGGKQAGARIKGISESFNGVHIELDLQLVRHQATTEPLRFSGLPLCITRHFRDTANPEQMLYHDVSKLKVTNYRRDTIWEASGAVRITDNPDEPITSLQPIEVVAARTFSEGFSLLGTETIYQYE